MFVQADHLVYFNFNRQTPEVFTFTVLSQDFFPVMRSNWHITCPWCSVRVLLNRLPDSAVYKALPVLSRKARCSISATHTWQMRNMCVHPPTHPPHQPNWPGLAQTNVQAPGTARGCTKVSRHLAALYSTAFAFRFVFNTLQDTLNRSALWH